MKRVLIYLLIIAIATPILYFVIYPISGYAQQKRNMQKAEDFIRIVRKALDGDKRFAQIELFSHYDNLGSFGVSGTIHANDVDELKRRVEATKPPVPIAWLMDITDQTDSPSTSNFK